MPNTHFSNDFSIFLHICANRIVKNNQHKLLLMWCASGPFRNNFSCGTDPQDRPKIELPKCAKNTFFQRFFNIFWSLHTSIYISFLTWSYMPSWPVLGPTESHLESSWSDLSLPKTSQHRSKTRPKTTSNLAPSWGPTSRPSRAQNTEKTNEKTIKKIRPELRQSSVPSSSPSCTSL